MRLKELEKSLVGLPDESSAPYEEDVDMSDEAAAATVEVNATSTTKNERHRVTDRAKARGQQRAFNGLCIFKSLPVASRFPPIF